MKSLGKILFLVTVLCFAVFANAQNGPSVPSVTLTITPGTPVSGATVTGYWIYRSTSSSACASTALNTTAITGTTYTDTAVTAGTTYYYCVTAAAGSINSPYSNMVTAAIAPRPAAPTLNSPTVTQMKIDIPAGAQSMTLAANISFSTKK